MKNFSLATVSVKYLNLRIVKKSADIGKMQKQCELPSYFDCTASRYPLKNMRLREIDFRRKTHFLEMHYKKI